MSWFRDRLVHHVTGLFLAVGYVTVLLATSSDLAMSRDESFYVVAAENSAAWLEAVWHEPGRLTERALIDRYWEYNHEHPALMKTLFGISWLVHKHWHVFPNDSAAFRFPGMVTAGLLLWVIYLFGQRVRGRSLGLFAALSFAVMPRVFYHSHLDCFDIPIVFFMTWVAYLYHVSLRQWRWLPLLGVAYGLALATKHNAWILPGVLAIHWLWMTAQGAAHGRGVRRWLRWVPWWLFAIVLIGVPVFVLSWPWLWHDGWERWLWYARFHTGHVHYHMAYFGKTYISPPFPMSFPWVMTAITIPATTLVLAAIGVATRVRAWTPTFLWRLVVRVSGAGAVMKGPDPWCSHVLWLGGLLAPVVVIALPHTPIFGGTKHWMTAHPFLALFAGAGFVCFVQAIQTLLRSCFSRGWLSRGWFLQQALPSLLGCACLLPAVIETGHSHPFGLSHYTMLAGHVPGSADLGMNRQFWGFTQGSLAAWFREAMPEGGSVWPADATHFAWSMMHRDGMLPTNIRVAGSMAAADYILVHHEHHFAEVDGQAWVVTGNPSPVHVLTYDGVPIVSVYKNHR